MTKSKIGKSVKGTLKSKKQYPTVKSLEKYHKEDNIFKI